MSFTFRTPNIKVKSYFIYYQMDPLLVVETAVSLSVAITNVASDIENFTRKVREARREFGDVTRELVSLKVAIEMLSEDLMTPGVTVPGSLQDIVKDCEVVIHNLQETVERYKSERLSGFSTQNQYTWSGKEVISTYKSTLSAHRVALDLAIDVMTLSTPRGVNGGVNGHGHGSDDFQTRTDRANLDTEGILERIAELQARLPDTLRSQNIVLDRDSSFMLQTYLEQLTEYTEAMTGIDEVDIGSEISDMRTVTDIFDDMTVQTGVRSEVFPEPPAEINAVAGNTTGQIMQSRAVERVHLVTPSNSNEPETSGSTENNHGLHSEVPYLREGLTTFLLPTRVPGEYATAGIEQKLGRQWRKKIVRAMRNVPQSDCDPRNGETYEQGVDYIVKESPTRGDRILPQLLEYDQARVIKWIRLFSMHTTYFYHQFNCVVDDSRTRIWTTPLMIAAEIHDWEWLDVLLARGAILNNIQYPLLGLNRGTRSFLYLCAKWNLALLQAMVEQLNARSISSTKIDRTWTLKHLITSLSTQERFQENNGMAIDKANILHAHAAEILISTEPPLGGDDLDWTLCKAIEKGNISLVESLLRTKVDLSHGSESFDGTPLHQAIYRQRWDIVKLLINAGADPFLKCKKGNPPLARILPMSKSYLTPIELAADQGRLGKLNSVLGTRYKDTRPMSLKITSVLIYF